MRRHISEDYLSITAGICSKPRHKHTQSWRAHKYNETQTHNRNTNISQSPSLQQNSFSFNPRLSISSLSASFSYIHTHTHTCTRKQTHTQTKRTRHSSRFDANSRRSCAGAAGWIPKELRAWLLTLLDNSQVQNNDQTSCWSCMGSCQNKDAKWGLDVWSDFFHKTRGSVWVIRELISHRV